jgi:hypothetical protein
MVRAYGCVFAGHQAQSRSLKLSPSISAAPPLLALGAILLAAPAASAEGPAGARHQLVAAHISPAPLFPTRLPVKLAFSRATFSRHGKLFAIQYVAGSPRRRTLIVTYNRAGRHALGNAVRQAQARHEPVRRVRLGSRRGYSFTSAGSFGYGWREGGYSYFIAAACCLRGRIQHADLRLMVSSARRLGVEYRGTTSQGKPVTLYSSSAGLDYDFAWTAACSDGRTRGPYHTVAKSLLRPNSSGAFSRTRSHRFLTHRSREKYSAVLAGSLTGAGAQGTWTAALQGPGYTCKTGGLSWQASRVP